MVVTPEELSYERWKSDQRAISGVKEALRQASSGRLVAHSTVKRLFASRYAPEMACDLQEAESPVKLSSLFTGLASDRR